MRPCLSLTFRCLSLALSLHCDCLQVLGRRPVRCLAAVSAGLAGCWKRRSPACLTRLGRAASQLLAGQVLPSAALVPSLSDEAALLGSLGAMFAGRAVRPPERKIRTPAHAKQLGWHVEFESRVAQATEAIGLSGELGCLLAGVLVAHPPTEWCSVADQPRSPARPPPARGGGGGAQWSPSTADPAPRSPVIRWAYSRKNLHVEKTLMEAVQADGSCTAILG